MKSIRITLSAAFVLAVSATLIDAAAVQAMNCDSVCNQIRRACRSEAMGKLKVAYADCDQDRDDCRVACDANAATCPDTCQTAFEACGGSTTPGCDAALEQCLYECDNCKTICNGKRVECRTAAKVARSDASLVCDALRDSCDGSCIGIDAECARGCKSDRRGCDGGVKRAEKTCRATLCPKGTGQRACVRSCRRQKNFDLAGCAFTEGGCYGTCIVSAP